MRRVPVLNALSVESIDFVISVVGQGALDLCIARGRVVLFKKFVLACVEAQLLQDSFECNKASSSTRLLYARLFLIVRIDGGETTSPSTFLFCQRGTIDLAPTESHGLRARRIRVDPNPMLLSPNMFSSVRVAHIFHDCPQAMVEGHPCQFVTDYPRTSFSGGRRTYVASGMFSWMFRTEIGVGVNHTPAALTWFEAPFFPTKICFENKMYLSNQFTMSGVALAAVVVGVRTLW